MVSITKKNNGDSETSQAAGQAASDTTASTSKAAASSDAAVTSDAGDAASAGEEGSADSNAKARQVVGQLMKNPGVLSLFEQKLSDLTSNMTSGYIQSLPMSVQRRIKALKRIQFECTKIEAEFYQEIHRLECKFAERYSPLFEKRKDIINGDYEPKDVECEWPSDEESDEEDDEEEKREDGEVKAKKPKSTQAAEEPAEGTKGIASFWHTAFKNVEMLDSMVQRKDEPILDALRDIRVNYVEEPMGFILNFEFAENDYFTDKLLTKQYFMKSAADEEDPFGFDGPEIISCKGCTIHWKDGKDVTVTEMKKKQKNAKTGSTRIVSKSVHADSFFHFFSPPSAPSDEEDVDDDTAALLQADFQIGHFIRERVVPHAVLYFTGEMDEESDDEEDDEESDDDEYDENADSDYDPSKDTKAKDCKTQ